ncbi:uncharacterized protein JCM15063_004116 [Sporobolomyces koalae]|uniref:uncharacterized protein n=1 Tax=Sporobolomyces koalae TaxID=500713 RepID=UPI0031765EA9
MAPRSSVLDTGPPPIHTATVQLAPSQPIGFALQHQLLFNSEQWIAPLHKDVNGLLLAFEAQWHEQLEGQLTSRNGTSDTRANVNDRSPFQVFKQLWVDQGWQYVHLLGIADGPTRLPWGQSVLRAFTEHLVPGEPPLRQIAALFAIYTFCATETPSMPKHFLKIDIPTLNHLLTFPALVAPALDPAKSSLLSPPPGSDVTIVLSAILSRSNPLFHLVPAQVFHHPRSLPCVGIRDARERDVDSSAKRLLGIEEEMGLLRRGRHDQLDALRRNDHATTAEIYNRLPFDPHSRSSSSDTRVSMRGGEGAGEGKARWISSLLAASSAYNTVKSRTTSCLTQPRSTLQLEVMNKAEEATMLRVRETGLEGTVARGVGAKTSHPDKGETNKRLFDLVRGYDDLELHKRRRRQDDTTESIRELDSVLDLIGSNSMPT